MCNVVKCGSFPPEITLIGEGATGFIQKINNKTVIKRFKDENHPSHDLILELLILAHSKHENIISLQGIYIDDMGEIAIAMDCADFDLNTWFHYNDSKYNNKIAYGILCGVGYLHSNNIIHGDIKPSNILMFNNTPKICDFGLSIISDDIIPGEICTYCYRAPELFLKQRTTYNNGIDLWATAITIWELYERREIFDTEDDSDQLNLIFSWLGSPTKENGKWILESLHDFIVPLKGIMKHKPRPDLKTRLDKYGLYELITSMLHYDPICRMSALEATQLSIFDKVRDVNTQPLSVNTTPFSYMCIPLPQDPYSKKVITKIKKYGKESSSITKQFAFKFLLSCSNLSEEIPPATLATHLMNLSEGLTSTTPRCDYNYNLVDYTNLKSRLEAINIIKAIVETMENK